MNSNYSKRRDVFAAAALQAFCSRPESDLVTADFVIKRSIELADGMLAAMGVPANTPEDPWLKKNEGPTDLAMIDEKYVFSSSEKLPFKSKLYWAWDGQDWIHVKGRTIRADVNKYTLWC